MLTQRTTAVELTSADDLRRLAGERLHSAPSTQRISTQSVLRAERSDFDLNPGMIDEIAPDLAVRHAAVLVPVIADSPLTLLLTTRSEHLPSHAGQISFPGGKIEPDDDGPLDTALREAQEEIGLDRRFVEPIGYLDSYQTRTGFLITPVVGLVQPGFALELDRREVASAFEVPLAFLMNPANHQRHSRLWQGQTRHFYAMPYGEHYIWGATAGMIKNLHEKLQNR